MALDNSTIRTTLAASSWSQIDDEARRLINNASEAELHSLDAEGVLRLFQALAMGRGIYMPADAAAMKRLATHSQFQKVTNGPAFAVGLIKAALPTQATVNAELSADLVERIYAAEHKRLSLLEKAGIDGATMGRGQLGEDAYTDVKKTSGVKTAWETCLMRVRLSQKLENPQAVDYTVFVFDMDKYTVKVPAFYENFVYKDRPLEDFVVAAYLAIRMKAATKPGRTTRDAARFAVAIYHGMWNMVTASQTAAKDDINWAPVAAELIAQGHADEVAYVNEVVI